MAEVRRYCGLIAPARSVRLREYSLVWEYSGGILGQHEVVKRGGYFSMWVHCPNSTPHPLAGGGIFGLATQASAATLQLGPGTFSPESCNPHVRGDGQSGNSPLRSASLGRRRLSIRHHRRRAVRGLASPTQGRRSKLRGLSCFRGAAQNIMSSPHCI